MTNHRLRGGALGIGLTLFVAGVALAQAPTEQPGGRNVSAMKFAPIPRVPTCTRAAVQSGDPATSPFILLVKSKTRCMIPWHWHTANERLMIVSGHAYIALRQENKKATLRAGGYAWLPARHVHELRCDHACTFFLYSDAKFDIHYVDPQGKEIPPEQALKPFKETAATAVASK